ncbi:MAG: hypothetical protein COS72_01970 [Candidatus Moranbacteria bacterium CG06_land_8_20_14_3_00_43_56]|nr:MAG: hypothetical protein COS72_01970 [Candidatus Moranbacteria bacterium CG06_land_8_20_14_3_00_43_56]PIV83725.1 MAG: hypothetical protein COW51_03235 [Candidatus Moranbacteria bacterium CG17_big_fil_post_rev_8_21_14_2_50_44_12]PIW93476.1 MAG: hypothetical protein COZ87_01065 [Candidatus Moranbacteria bacterium CG_4_8_14_3_um_filter_43_15]PJA85414.1 MAG: hypothetical protein CO142_03885 [Candidatus Moranbacteria bacterium CG_4_9_14_3_um_filter_44_28]
MKRKTGIKTIFLPLLIAVIVAVSGFCFSVDLAEAKKKKTKSKVTKWQSMLERNGIDRALWEKYLPKVSRGEYKKVKKALKKMGIANSGSLGASMRIGLFSLDPDAESSDRKVELKTVSGSYTLKDINGTPITTISSTGSTAIRIGKDKIFEVRLGDLGSFEDYGKKIVAEPSGSDGVIKIDNCKNDKYDTDGNGNRFAIGCYGSYDEFRGKIELSLDDNETPWVINELPLEQYTWGTGEIGDLDYEYYKLFSIIYRTYGYYNLQHKKKTHKDHNFDLSDTSSDQIYKGYKIESNYPNMKKATEDTRGKIVTYKGEAALTPYCSWSDGHTRDYPGDDFSYIKGRKDKYGKHPSKSAKKLEDSGNHMYGLIANGARKMVKKGKNYGDVINYYYTGVKIEGIY